MRVRDGTACICICARIAASVLCNLPVLKCPACARVPCLYSSALPVLARLYRISSAQRKKSTSVRRESSRLDSLNTSRSDIGTPSLTPHTPSRCQQLRRRGCSFASSTPPRWMPRVDLRTLRCRRRCTRRSAAMALLGCSHTCVGMATRCLAAAGKCGVSIRPSQPERDVRSAGWGRAGHAGTAHRGMTDAPGLLLAAVLHGV